MFYEGVSISEANLFAITETGCNDSVHDSELIPPGYHIIRCDRADGRKQGGACLVATPRFELRRMAIPGDVIIDNQVFELVSATVYLHNRFLFLCCVIYIPPNSKENDYMIMFKIIEDYCNIYRDVLVLGDFNLHFCPVNITHYYECFRSYCGFIQSNDIINSSGRCLDLVLSTQYEGSVCVKAAAPLIPPDPYHPALEVQVRLGSSFPTLSGNLPNFRRAAKPLRSAQWNFNKADFLGLYMSIAAIDWSEIRNLDLESSLLYFYNTINTVLDDYVPKKKRNPGSPMYIYPEWYTSEIISEIKQKAYLLKRYKHTKSPSDYSKYSECRARLKKYIKHAHEKYRDRVQHHLSREPKAFWNYIKSKRGNRQPRTIVKNGEVLMEEECAGEFARFFQSVYKAEQPLLDVDASVAGAATVCEGARVHLDCLNLDDVRGALQRLKPKTSVGPDGIPPFLFRDCREVLAEPLLHIYNLCLKSAVFPETWKLTRVVPIPKGKMSSNVEGYRPVAILSTPAKVLEAAVHKRLYAQVSA
ncbi:unnamed protein product [Euphydryas editha]|uniref:Reverse transcriptase n=1 Tax=Euphydryas editha TaxID=104508 RepID=A0AAU9UHL0_EUPED|nr:unnamed protein product [Euphydryas editha]